VDWPLPPWGYMAMFCCNVATTDGPKPGHQPIEAVVEFRHARLCSVVNGGVTHAGGMGICLREGTAQVRIEGNEIGDLGGGGVAAGWPNSAAGYLEAAPPPEPGDFSGFRIANNYVHDCGTDYFGAVGILLFPMRQSVITHNLIHNTAYLGIGMAGSQDPKVTFDGDNVVEYNHIQNTMMTTVDGAGIYITFAHHGGGTLVRGNLIHDTAVGKGRVPSAGLYLDGNCSGCRFEHNVLYRNNAAGPLIFNFDSKKDNIWIDNVFQATGIPPDASIEAWEAYAGPEPAYRELLRKSQPDPCARYFLENSSAQSSDSAIQFHFSSKNHGVIQFARLEGKADDIAGFKLFGLDRTLSYELQAYSAPVAPQNVWGGPGVTQQMPMAGKTNMANLADLGLPVSVSGRDLMDKGLVMKFGNLPQVVWIVYHVAK
jgi:hypothetical protein